MYKNLLDNDLFRSITQQQVQELRLESYSKANWEISEPNLQNFKEEVKSAIQNNLTVSFQMQLVFHQKSTDSNFTYSLPIDSKNPSQKTSLVNLTNALTTSNCGKPMSPFLIPVEYNPYIDISSGNGAASTFGGTLFVQKDIFLGLSCQVYNLIKNNETTQLKTAMYWNLFQGSYSEDGNKKGLKFVTVCGFFAEEVSAILQTSTLTAVYFSIIYLIGESMRAAFFGKINNIWANEMPKGENILRIYEGIVAARGDGNIAR